MNPITDPKPFTFLAILGPDLEEPVITQPDIWRYILAHTLTAAAFHAAVDQHNDRANQLLLCTAHILLCHDDQWDQVQAHLQTVGWETVVLEPPPKCEPAPVLHMLPHPDADQ